MDVRSSEIVKEEQAVSDGGLDTPKNCVACCSECNQVKGGKDVAGLIEKRETVIQKMVPLRDQLQRCDLIIARLGSQHSKGKE